MSDRQFALLIRTIAYGFYCVVKTLTVAAMFQRDSTEAEWPRIGRDLENDIRKALRYDDDDEPVNIKCY